MEPSEADLDGDDALADLMREVPGGRIVLKDEGTSRVWYADVSRFSLARVPVTAALYDSISSSISVSSSQTTLVHNTPRVDVSWIDAVRFCNQLSMREGLELCYKNVVDEGMRSDAESVACNFDADGFRLPTEAEWEMACRAGSQEARYGDLDEIAWYRGNASDELHDVGLKAPNAWGFYDMLGNVWEWCWDVYDPAVYGPYRVFRGGGFADLPHGCRASCRRKSHPMFQAEDVGFRLARSIV